MNIFRHSLRGKQTDENMASSQTLVVTPLQRPTPTEIMRYRYHHGTNLGSIYVLEKWLFPKLFPKDSGPSELDAVRASIAAIGIEATREKWESHWQNAILKKDWKWLTETAHCTTIRLPIGYYTLGRDFCNGTPFQGEITQVYVNAWQSVKSLVRNASSHGIGILLDLHALPGGANKDAHSGTSNKSTNLWTDDYSRQLAKECALFLAREIVQDREFGDAIIGIQVVNEAKWKAERMFEWYDEVITAIGQIKNDIPVYISDAWDMKTAIGWVKKRNEKWRGMGNPVVVDTHRYYCFGKPNTDLHPHEVIREKVPREFEGVDLAPSARAPSLVVGEWSCVLGETAWGKVSKEERVTLTTEFGLAESRKWFEKTGGSFFWTWKLGWMPGGSWGFSKQINEGNLFIPPGLLLDQRNIAAKMNSARQFGDERLVNSKTQYCHMKGKAADAIGFSQGWKDGFEDAMEFLGSGGNTIGLVSAWIHLRMGQSGRTLPEAQSWTEGFERGVWDFREMGQI